MLANIGASCFSKVADAGAYQVPTYHRRPMLAPTAPRASPAAALGLCGSTEPASAPSPAPRGHRPALPATLRTAVGGACGKLSLPMEPLDVRASHRRPHRDSAAALGGCSRDGHCARVGERRLPCCAAQLGALLRRVRPVDCDLVPRRPVVARPDALVEGRLRPGTSRASQPLGQHRPSPRRAARPERPRSLGLTPPSLGPKEGQTFETSMTLCAPGLLPPQVSFSPAARAADVGLLGYGAPWASLLRRRFSIRERVAQ